MELPDVSKRCMQQNGSFTASEVYFMKVDLVLTGDKTAVSLYIEPTRERLVLFRRLLRPYV